MDNTPDTQLNDLVIIERVCSVFSLLGCIFIIVTFCASRGFHKPINRLVFYASFGNMLTNVGTLMSRSFIDKPNSVGCQIQGFTIQLFMPADCFWTLAMAVNVYLTFYHKFDAERLRRMEIFYLIACYGIPFIPALAFLFIKSSTGTRVYGDASLWCWICQEWDILRIAVFYGPVWVMILITFFIYARAGRTIYEKHKQLRNFQSSDPDPLTMMSINCDGFGTVKTTEVIVTSETAAAGPGIPMGAVHRRESDSGSTSKRPDAYSVQIIADSTALPSEAILPAQEKSMDVPQCPPRRPGANLRRRHQDLNNAAWSYTKCAILFFTAILITWLPSSTNRVYGLVHQKQSPAALSYMSAFVLPLQGFWNAIIYAVTSWSACKSFFRDLRTRQQPTVSEVVGTGRSVDQNDIVEGKPNRPSHYRSSSRNFDSDSMTELAKPRTMSDDSQF